MACPPCITFLFFLLWSGIMITYLDFQAAFPCLTTNCDAHSHCVVTSGSALCVCNDGYVDSPTGCVDACFAMKVINADCVLGVCTCHPGFIPESACACIPESVTSQESTTTVQEPTTSTQDSTTGPEITPDFSSPYETTTVEYVYTTTGDVVTYTLASQETITLPITTVETTTQILYTETSTTIATTTDTPTTTETTVETTQEQPVVKNCSSAS